MATNPYFNNVTYTPTQDLIENLIIENIKIYGLDMIYIPRNLVNEDVIYGEDRESRFQQFYTIEMYINSFDGFGGQSDFISKFGLEAKDEIQLSVSKKRFFEVTNAQFPEEGDLIYFSLSDHLFQIDHVEYESPFFQQGKRFIHFMKCSTYDYSHDNFQTGNVKLDSVDIDYANINSVINDKYAQNLDIIDKAEDIVTFDPDNPFNEV